MTPTNARPCEAGGTGTKAGPSSRSKPSRDDDATDALRDADGCAWQLYAWLWRRNARGESCPGILLPDTAVFGPDGELRAWYFMGKGKARGRAAKDATSSPTILRKHARHTSWPRLLAALEREPAATSATGTPSAACLAHKVTTLAPPDAASPHAACASVEFLDASALRTRLASNPGDRSDAKEAIAQPPRGGILQRRVGCSGEARHAVVCAVWSPSVCLVERRASLRPLHDASSSLPARLVTFEGKASYRWSGPLPLLPNSPIACSVRNACNGMAKHVCEVSQGRHRISRMVAYFRIDDENRCWFTWASSLRVAGAGGGGAKEGGGGEGGSMGNRMGWVPEQTRALDLEPAVVVIGEGGGCAQRRCPGCLGVFPGRDVAWPVPYKTIILHHDRIKPKREGERQEDGKEEGEEEREGSPRGGGVPPTIQREEGPAFTPAKYAILVHNPAFLYKTCAVCMGCCLELSTTAMEDLAAQNPAVTATGTPALAPPPMPATQGRPASAQASFEAVKLRMRARMGTEGERRRGERERPASAAATTARKSARAGAAAAGGRGRPLSALPRTNPPASSPARPRRAKPAWGGRERRKLGGGGPEAEGVSLATFQRVNDLTPEELDFLRQVL